MKKIFVLLILLITLPVQVFAVEDPLKTPNNKIGIHILFDHELEKAAEFVNSSGGQWGYVTIPLQIGDRDLIKWQNFFDRAKKLRVIPIIRLASEGDYFNTSVWTKPKAEDIVDFANFLESLSWPVKNRYIIIFNEVNRADEWGGTVDPEDYAGLLSFAVTVFKSKSQDFFIISAGMDNAAPDKLPEYMNEYSYYRRMNDAVPGIFNQLDGFSSHSYPNPGFAQPPEMLTSKSISSFIYERELIRDMRNKDIPVFITETGWNAGIAEETKALYYEKALSTAWADPGIVAITPFLLNAGDGPFKGFSFLKPDGTATIQMKILQKIPKVAGRPQITLTVLGLEKKPLDNLPVRNFNDHSAKQQSYSISEIARESFKWMLKL